MFEFVSRAVEACFGRVKGSGRTGAELEKHFWSKVDHRGDCWLWAAGKNHRGYGQFCAGGKMVVAHRYAFELVNGPIPNGLCVCHKCDVRACCNPTHHFLGTDADNVADMILKNRHAKGTQNGQAKLTDEIVREIRAARGTQEEIAKRFGTSRGTVCNIRLRKLWKHVLDAEGFTPPERETKLTESQVREIRKASGTQVEIAKRFGISRSMVGYIKRHEVWKHVSDPHQSEPQVACFSLESIEHLFAHYRQKVSSDEAASNLVLAHVNERREPPEDRMLTTDEVAKLLNISTDLVYAMARDGKLRSVKLGKLTRFKRSWLDDVTTPKRVGGRHW